MKSQVYSNMCYCIYQSTPITYHLFNHCIKFLNEAKINIKCTSSARIWGFVPVLLSWDSLLLSVFTEKGFPELADSFVVMSWEAHCWELAEDGFGTFS